MELVFNLVWLTLSFGLVLSWTATQHGSANESPRCSTRMQIVALAMLIVILLPVVSLTDDLQACTAPAEAEHLGRRVDLQVNADTCMHVASIFVATHLAVEHALRLQRLAYLDPAMATKAPSAGYLRIAGSRPPPFA